MTLKELDIDRTQHMTSTANVHSLVETYIEMFKTHPRLYKSLNLVLMLTTCFKPIYQIIQNIDSSKAYKKNNTRL